jgi:DNA-directed RNA polymerase subunit N (RpoN/RPB10)
MLYPICPTCGALLSNIQLPYQHDIKELCEKYNVDIELISRGIANDDKFNIEKERILNKYTDVDRYCCRMRLSNFSEIVKIVG